MEELGDVDGRVAEEALLLQVLQAAPRLAVERVQALLPQVLALLQRLELVRRRPTADAADADGDAVGRRPRAAAAAAAAAVCLLRVRLFAPFRV